MSDQNNNAHIPPQAVEIEETVLGGMMLDSEAADLAFMNLSEADFYNPSNRKIFQGLWKLYEQQKPGDLLTLEVLLREQGDLDAVGGIEYLSDLSRRVSSTNNISYHCEILREKTIRRTLIKKCHAVIGECYDNTTDTFDVVDRAQSAVFGVVDTGKGSMQNISESIESTFQYILHLQESGIPAGLRTGMDIDKTLQGFQGGRLYVIGARPSMGKTALVLTIMRRLAHEGKKTGVISLETTKQALNIRLISQTSSIPADRVTSSEMTIEEVEKCFEAKQKLMGCGIVMDDQPAITAQQARSKCRLMAKRGVEIIFVDFLQLLSESGRSRHEEIGAVTKVLKAVSKELDIPIVALSQLSRKVEDRSDKRPQMADLRESGSIEEDADAIMFLYRPEYYGITTTPEGKSTEGLCEVIIAKNKDGKTGMQALRFLEKYMRFENYAHNQQHQKPPAKPFHEPQRIDLDDEPLF